MVIFKKGDQVRLKHQGRFSGAWDGPMVVDQISQLTEAILARHPICGLGGFNESTLELVEGPW